MAGNIKVMQSPSVDKASDGVAPTELPNPVYCRADSKARVVFVNNALLVLQFYVLVEKW